jgi:hypothetical protein
VKNLFRKYKTIDQLLPGFLLEVEAHTKLKTSSSYHGHVFVFIEWLKDNRLDKVPLRKLSSDNIHDFFNYLGIDKDLDRSTCEKYFLHLRLFSKSDMKEDIQKNRHIRKESNLLDIIPLLWYV